MVFHLQINEWLKSCIFIFFYVPQFFTHPCPKISLRIAAVRLFFAKQRCSLMKDQCKYLHIFFLAEILLWKEPLKKTEKWFDTWLHAFTHVIEIMRDDCFELIVISYWSFCLIQASAVRTLTGAMGRCTKDIICITSDCNFLVFFRADTSIRFYTNLPGA